MLNIKQLIRTTLTLALLTLGSFQPTWAESLTLGTGDTVKITVYGQPDLTTTTRIQENGRITFPLIGDLTVSGLTTTQAERNIADLLGQRGLVSNAQVNIYLEERSRSFSNSVTILGQVARPGKYPLQEDSVEGVQSVVDLLAVAGGTNDKAADYLIVINKKNGTPTKSRVDLYALLKEGEINYNKKLEGGDVVLVPQMDVFYIYGQVESPGRFRLEPAMTVMQALSVAGGLTDRGSENGISLKRRDDKGNLKTINIESADQLQAGDVLYVKEGLF